jgi:hypothetical protein
MYKIEEESNFDIKSLYETKEDYDIELEARDGNKVKAHKLILKMKSEYFKILFSEKYESKEREIIKFEDVSYTTLSETIKYIYISKCIFESFDELIDCYIFANKIKYNDLENCLLDMIDPLKISSKDSVTDIVKKLLNVKYINEEILLKKIQLLLNKKEGIEDDIKLQELCKSNDLFWYSNGHSTNISTYTHFNKNKWNNYGINKYLADFNYGGKTFEELSYKKKLYVLPILKKNLLRQNCGCGYDCNCGKGAIEEVYQFKLLTERTLLSEYPFIKKFKMDKIFKKETEIIKNREVYVLIYNEYVIDKIMEEIKNTELIQFMY